jgi:hypothetical protein
MTHEATEAWLADVRQVLAAGTLLDPPDWVRQRAYRLYPTQSRRTTPLMTRVRAFLFFDSRQPGVAAAGVRSLGLLDSAMDGPWQLLYRGGDVDIDLLVRPNQDGRTMNVRGQALSLVGDGVGSGSVEAMPAGVPGPSVVGAQPAFRSEVEPTGEFALPNVERGRYDMLLRFGAREIELNDVEL